MMRPTLRRALVTFTALATAAALHAGCASASGASGSSDPDDNRFSDLNTVGTALNGQGMTAEVEDRSGNRFVRVVLNEGKLVTLIFGMDDNSMLRMSTIWGRDKSQEPDVALMLKINELNNQGIVKVYLDSDGDVWTEQYLTLDPSMTDATLAHHVRAFSARSVDAMSSLVDYIQ